MPRAPLPPRPAEAHALEIARDLPGERILCTSIGRAQAARALSEQRPGACVTAWFLDLYRLERAYEEAAAADRIERDGIRGADRIDRDGIRGDDRIERDGIRWAEGPSAPPRPLCGPESRPACPPGQEHNESAATAETPGPRGASPSQVVFTCTPDMPPGPFDLVVLPFAKDGEAELTRDILQQGLAQLRIGGHLVVAIDNPRDKWLREQLAATGETVRVREAAGEKPETICYLVTKTREPAKLRDFTCTITFRDRERLLEAVSRPGVFAHRRIDPGARHLLNAVDVAAGIHVLDIGCGSGCVALGIAARDPSVRVHAIDSAARAVECTRKGAELNGLDNVTVALEASGRVPDPGNYDLVLANPPYYADFRIAGMFVDAAWNALAPGGTLLVVTKQPTWYLENLPKTWQDVAQEFVKRYHLIEAVRPG